MRMFLVGMCDIFLILYLTTISGVDERGVSELTVEDYLEVKEAQQELKDISKVQEETLAALEQELQNAEASKNSSEGEKRRLKVKLDALTEQEAKLNEQLVLSEAEKKKLLEQKKTLEKHSEESKFELAELRESSDKLKNTLEEAERLKAQQKKDSNS